MRSPAGTNSSRSPPSGSAASRRSAAARSVTGVPSRMRFNHMELTFPRGTLTQEFRDEVDAFYGSIFGWKSSDTELLGQTCHLLQPDPDQFILLAEGDKPMSSPGYDHLGLLQDTRQEVDEILDACKRYAAKDLRVQIKEYKD